MLKIHTRMFAAPTLLLVGINLAGMQNCAAEPKTVEAVGKIVEMVPSKKEIYVLTESGKNEYYFSEQTVVALGATEKSYADLEVGDQVKVLAIKIGKRLDPLRVELLER